MAVCHWAFKISLQVAGGHGYIYLLFQRYDNDDSEDPPSVKYSSQPEDYCDDVGGGLSGPVWLGI